MKSSSELWKDIHGSFEYHRKSHDPDAQSAMDRVAMKCLGAAEKRSFNPTNCAVREEVLSPGALKNLAIYHERSSPIRMEGPIVILRIDGRDVVIDGNTRANAWKTGKYPGPFTAIFVEPIKNVV